MQKRDVIIKELGLESWQWDDDGSLVCGEMPGRFECPDCHGLVWFEFYEWKRTEFGPRVNPDGSGVHIGCADLDCNGPASRQPYVGWLPICARALDFIVRVELMMDSDEPLPRSCREKLGQARLFQEAA